MSDTVARLNTALEGRYVIERKLGEGGMATVYLAEDEKHGRKVALKVLRSELGEALGAERFLREIRIAAQLSHPNIVALIDSGEADGLLYYMMFYVEGESLRQRLDREKQLPVDEALRIAHEVGQALGYAHERGVVHRDVKPENILLERGHVRVADFGIAKALHVAGSDRLTHTGLSIGTPDYMSPEQATADEVDERADIYSLACVLYEMLAGSPPFTAATPHAILARKALEKPPGLRVIRSTVPEALEAAIVRALRPTPADRQATVEDFVSELTAGAARTRLGHIRQAGRRWRSIAVASALLVAAVGAGLTRLGVGGDSAPPLVATFTQLTSEPGLEDAPCVSPDGEWVVYAADGNGDRDIFLRSVGGQNPLLLTAGSSDDDTQPVFSRDGARIAFRSSRDGGGIFVMGRTGEGVRRVTDDGFHPDWSPDGTKLVYTLENVGITPLNMELSSDLWVVDVGGGEPAPLGVADGADPSWSPNGHRIAYGARSVEGARRLDIMTIAADGGPSVPVTRDEANDWSPAWSADGRHIYFVSDRGGSMNLWRAPVDERSGRVSGALEPVTAPAQFVAHPCVSADGRHLVFSSVVTTTQNVQKAAFDPAATVLGEAIWLTTGSRRWANPDPSADGSRITLYSQDRPEGDLYVMAGDGTGLRQLTADSAIDRVPRWSPDGSRIAYFSNRGGPLDVWTIRPDGSDNRQLTFGDRGVPAWSPDGSRIVAPGAEGNAIVALSGGGSDGAVEWLAPPPPTLGRFTANDWSPDGRYIAGSVDYRDTGIVVYSVDGETYDTLTDFGHWPVFLPDSRRILFVSEGHALHIVDLSTREVVRIYSTPWDVIGPPRLTADGRQMLFTRRVTEGDVWLARLR